MYHAIQKKGKRERGEVASNRAHQDGPAHALSNQQHTRDIHTRHNRTNDTNIDGSRSAQKSAEVIYINELTKFATQSNGRHLQLASIPAGKTIAPEHNMQFVQGWKKKSPRERAMGVPPA